jgi:hypothetical protein
LQKLLSRSGPPIARSYGAIDRRLPVAAATSAARPLISIESADSGFVHNALRKLMKFLNARNCQTAEYQRDNSGDNSGVTAG